MTKNNMTLNVNIKNSYMLTVRLKNNKVLK